MQKDKFSLSVIKDDILEFFSSGGWIIFIPFSILVSIVTCISLLSTYR